MPGQTGWKHCPTTYIAPEIPLLNSENCVACMACVIECPDTAILGKVVPKAKLEAELAAIPDEAERERSRVTLFPSNPPPHPFEVCRVRGWRGRGSNITRQQFGKTTKFWNVHEKKGDEPGYFGIFIDPTTVALN